MHFRIVILIPLRSIAQTILFHHKRVLGYGFCFLRFALLFADNVTEKYLNLQFNQFGSISHVTIDRERGHALIYFEQVRKISQWNDAVSSL